MDPDPEPFLIFLNTIGTMEIIEITALLLLLLSSALISGTEVAFFSLSQTDLNKLSEESKGESLIGKPKTYSSDFIEPTW